MTNFQFPNNFRNHNFGFTKSSRFVWQKSEPKSSETFSESEEEESEFSLEEFGEILDFHTKIQDACSAAKQEGAQTIADSEEQICTLSDIHETVKLKQFVDELGEKYLNTLAGEDFRFQTKDSFERLQVLQEVTDWPAIMERFGKAESYEIKSYQEGKKPAMIIFTYAPDESNPEGRTEKYPLELSNREKSDVIWKGLSAVIEGRDGRTRRQAESILKSIDEEGIKDEELVGFTEKHNLKMEEMMREQAEGWRVAREDQIDRSRYLNTPETALGELTDMKYRGEITSLPDDLLEELSDPLSIIAEVWSNTEVDYDNDYNMTGLDGDQYRAAAEEIMGIMENYYGPEWKNSINRKDAMAIGETFGFG